ncbi:hypothetical protein JCM11491_004389 [Sporobolomyces phaffii]
MSKQSLSKGTLGLKFMNRTVPPSTPPTAPSDPPPTRSTSSAAPAPTAAPATVRPRTVTHDTSLLSFPILSASAASGFVNSNSYYNSMPLTSTAISGRRSFGGANVEIERLNDPTSHQAPPLPEGAAKDKASKSSLKKKQRDLPISARRTDHPTTTSTKRAPQDAAGSSRQQQQQTQQQKKKRRISGPADDDGDLELAAKWEGDEDQVSLSSGFKKPGGFEGAKLNDKGKGRAKGHGGLLDLDQHKWGKRGDTREWDREKPTTEEYELGSEEDDQRILDGIDDEFEEDDDDESESESEDDEEEIRRMLVSAKALDRKRSSAAAAASKVKKDFIEREVGKREGQSMGESPRKGKGKSKARR